MTTEEYQTIDIPQSLVGTVVIGDDQLPFVDLDDRPFVSSKIRANGTEYSYLRSFPVMGHSAIMPAAVDQLRASGKQVLVAERNERYYVYAA